MEEGLLVLDEPRLVFITCCKLLHFGGRVNTDPDAFRVRKGLKKTPIKCLALNRHSIKGTC